MKLGFVLVALVILISINAYVWLRGWQALPSSIFRPAYLSIAVSLFLALIVSMVWGNSLPAFTAKTISFLGFSYLIVLIYLLFSFLAVDLVRIVNYFVHFCHTGMIVFRFWAMAISLIVIGVAMLVGNYRFNHPKVVNLTISSNKPMQHKKIKIVAASDLHLGISIDKKKFQAFVKLINDQHPDIVLLAGDISDRWVEPIIRQNMAEEFRGIKAPLGVYAINGNHEHYAETSDATSKYLQSAGVTVLRDEAVLVDSSFYVVGRADRSNIRRKMLSALTQNLDRSKPIILLDHQPFHLEEAELNGVDLQISGHTHKGQFFPGNLIVNNMYEKAHGYLLKGNTHYYISSGLGIWGPQYRIGTQSEIVVVELKL